jgi:hypothetical protein
MLANMPGASLAKEKSFRARTVKLLLTLRHMVERQMVEDLDWKSMEQRTLKNVNNHFNTNIYSFLETSVACIIKVLRS